MDSKLASDLEISLVAPILQQDSVTAVYVAECCGRVYVGIEPPKHCQNHPSKELNVRVYKRN